MAVEASPAPRKIPLIRNSRIKVEREKTCKDIEAAIANEKSKLTMLGRRPIEETDPIVLILSLAYFPVPIGWAVWIGTLQVFNSKSEEIGIFCIILLIVGYFANREESRKYNTHMKKLEPFSNSQFDFYGIK